MRATRTSTALAAVALTALLAACTSDDAETPADADTTTDATDEGAEEDEDTGGDGDELQAAADAIGCDGYEQSGDPAPYVDKWGTCDLDGVGVQLYYIPDDADYDTFMEASSAYGVTDAWVVRAGAIVAAPEDQNLVDQLRADLGA